MNTPQKVLNKIRDKLITHNIFRIQDNDSVVWILLHCFHRIYVFRKTLLDYTSLFSSNDCQKNDKIICRYFGDKYVKSRV